MSCQASTAVINPKNYEFLLAHVYSHAGIVLEGDKHYLFECRPRPIVRQLGLSPLTICARSSSPRTGPKSAIRCRGNDDE